MWTVTELENESDVEQKFIFPLLVESQPLGLGLPPAVIQTKSNIRRFSIGKGSDQKLYFPDYLVVTLGFPIIVVEAKHPKESNEVGYREARLYANELNGLYPHGVDPASFVIASNGVELWYGYSDRAEPLGRVYCSDLGVYSPHLAKLVELFSWGKLQEHAIAIAQILRPEELFKPRRMLGGVAVQNEEVGQNTFGATLTTSISPIFNPSTLKDRAFIARNGYISSRRRERYVDPIDRVIRAARPPSEVDATEFEDSAKPTEIISQLKKHRELEHKVLLVIGSVGSGKSTFIDHLYEVALPRDIISTSVWCRINMNMAPISHGEIYSWLRQEIIKGCRLAQPNDDFDDLEVIEKVYSVEINKFKKGIGKLYEKQPQVFNIKLAEHIQNIQTNEHAVANAHVRFTCADRNKLLIVVLDNCDKKTRDEQLLMFEAAQWIQNEFRCLVILPLRDETYDNHRDQPPLDTALKDLVFRIEPPLFQQVLISRVQLALNELSGNGKEKLLFSLPNGFSVSYARSDQAFYLTAIVRSLFEHDKFIRRMIVGISGRNMRRALEIFLEFCNSGHIGEDQIFKIRQSEGRYPMPLHQVATVLLRMNRRFYDSDHSYIKNIFAANKNDSLPGFFCRYMILRWLRNNFGCAGTNGLRGYFPKRDIKAALIPYGLSLDVLDREFNYLLAAQCVIAEHLRLDSVDDEDLVRLGPAGFVHLELVGNVNYLAAVAEDTFFSDRHQAEEIANRIRNPQSHLTIKTAVDNASELVNYLEQVRSSLRPPHGSFMQNDLLESLAGFTDAHEAIKRVAKSQSGDPWFDADKRLPRGTTHEVTVQNVVEFGCFVEFDDGLRGLVHKSNYNGIAANQGDRVKIKILWLDAHQHRMSLEMMAIVAEDVGDQVDGIFGCRGASETL